MKVLATTRSMVLTAGQWRLWVRPVAFVGGTALLTALAALIRIPLPFTPVPLTLQTAVVLLAGGLLGWRLGALSQGLYVGLAALGLPLLAGPALAGPTGGYLLGFVLAALLMGLACERWGAGGPWAGALLGMVAIYGCGSWWLSLVTGQPLLVSLQLGVVPFVAGDILKTAGVVAALKLARRWSLTAGRY